MVGGFNFFAKIDLFFDKMRLIYNRPFQMKAKVYLYKSIMSFRYIRHKDQFSETSVFTELTWFNVFS